MHLKQLEHIRDLCYDDLSELLYSPLENTYYVRHWDDLLPQRAQHEVLAEFVQCPYLATSSVVYTAHTRYYLFGINSAKANYLIHAVRLSDDWLAQLLKTPALTGPWYLELINSTHREVFPIERPTTLCDYILSHAKI